MSTTEARASVDRASRAVAALAFERNVSPGELEALAAITLALESLAAKVETIEKALRWKEDAL